MAQVLPQFEIHNQGGDNITPVSFPGYLRGNFDAGIIMEVKTKRSSHNASFSGDSKYLIVGGEERVYVFSTFSWEVLLEEEMDDVTAAIFSGDGKCLAFARLFQKVSVFSTSSWELLHEKDEIAGDVCAVSYSGDGMYLAVGSNWNVYVFSTLSWAVLYEEKRADVTAVSFSSDGKHLAVSSASKMTVLSTLSWEVVHEVKGPAQSGLSIFSAGGKYLAVGLQNQNVIVFGTSCWEVVHEVKTARRIPLVSFSGDGKYLAIGIDDNSVTVFSTSSWEMLHEEVIVGKLNTASFSGDGMYLAVGGRVVTILSTLSWSVFYEENVVVGNVYTVIFSGDGKYLAVGDNSTLSVINISSWMVKHEVERACVVLVSFSADGKHLAITGDGKHLGMSNEKLTILSTSCWAPLHEMTISGRVTAIGFSEDAKYLAVCSFKKASILSTSSWEMLHEVATTGEVAAVSFSPDGKYLAVGSFKNVYVLTTLTWEVLRDEQLSGYVYAVSFSPDGKYLAVGSAMKLYVFITLTWEVLHDLVMSRDVETVSFSPDGKYLGVCSYKKAYVFGTSSWNVLHEEDEVISNVHAVSFSGDGKYLAVGKINNKVVIVSTSSWMVVHEVKMTSKVMAVSFSGDGKFLAVCSYQKVVVIGLGPVFFPRFAPLASIRDLCVTKNIESVLGKYCRNSNGRTLLQCYVEDGFDHSAMEAILNRCPKLVCAENISIDCDEYGSDIFHTAISRNDTRLLLLLFRVVFSLITFNMAVTNACDLIHRHQTTIIRKYPDLWVKALKLMVLRRNIRYSTSEAKCSAPSWTTSASCVESIPWEKEDLVSDGEVWAMVVPYPHMGSLATLDLVVLKCSVEVMENDVMGFVLDLVWSEHISLYFKMDVSVYLLFCFLWIWLQETAYGGNLTLRQTLFAMVLILNCCYLCKEIRAFLSSWGGMTLKYHSFSYAIWHHFRDGWNLPDLLFIAFVFMSSTAALNGDGDSTVKACAAFFLMIKLLSYMRGFDSTGWLITVLIQNAIDVRGFFILILIILGGFTVVFKILLREVEGACNLQLPSDDTSDWRIVEDCDADPFARYGLAGFKVFTMGIMGDYDSDHFDSSESPWASRAFFLILVVAVSVVALNALIALLGDSYSRIQEKSTANKNMEKAKLIVEYLSILPRSVCQVIEEKTRYIHVLVPKAHLLLDGHVDNGNESEWEGTINATKRAIESSAASLENSLNDKLSSYQKSLNDKVSVLDEKVSSLQTSVRSLESRIDALLAAVRTSQSSEY